jgi:hypothetical protein
MPAIAFQKYSIIALLLLVVFPHSLHAERIPWFTARETVHNPKVPDRLGLKFIPEQRDYISENGLEFYTTIGGKNEKYFYEWVAFVDRGKVVFQQQGRFISRGFSRSGKTMFAVTYEQHHIVYYYYREGKLGVIKSPSYAKVDPKRIHFETHSYYDVDDSASWVLNGAVGDGFIKRFRRCDAFENCFESLGALDIAFLSDNRFAELGLNEVIVYQGDSEVQRVDLNQEIKWRYKGEGSFRVFDNTLVVRKGDQIAIFDLDTGLFVWQFDRKGLETKVKGLYSSYFQDGYLIIPFNDGTGFFRRKLSWR